MKARQIDKALTTDRKVEVVVVFRGREQQMMELLAAALFSRLDKLVSGFRGDLRYEDSTVSATYYRLDDDGGVRVPAEPKPKSGSGREAKQEMLVA